MQIIFPLTAQNNNSYFVFHLFVFYHTTPLQKCVQSCVVVLYRVIGVVVPLCRTALAGLFPDMDSLLRCWCDSARHSTSLKRVLSAMEG